MSDAKRLAGLVGPTLAAMVAAEFPSIQPDLYAHQIPPVVYLSGVLMFVGGLAIVRAHNVWKRDWTVLLTLTGWLALLLGLFRMFAASHYQKSAANVATTTYMLLEGFLFVVGLFLTFKAYGPSRDSR
jgi:uncharacterized membrane protein HdeD (DUF308 family)